MRRRGRARACASRLLGALLVAACAPPASASSCQQAGCDAFRSHTAGVPGAPLPNDVAPPQLEAVVGVGGAGPGASLLLLQPVLLTSDATALLLAVSDAGNVTAWRRGGASNAPASWGPPLGGGLSAPCAGAQLVVLGEDGVTACARALLVCGDGTLFGVVVGAAVGSAVTVAPAWGPVGLPGGEVPAGPVLLLGGSASGGGGGGYYGQAFIPAGSGAVYVVTDPGGGGGAPGVAEALPAAAAVCGGAPDSAVGGLTALAVGGGPTGGASAVALVTSRGCAVALGVRGGGGGGAPLTPLWARPPPAELTPGASLVLGPPSFDPALQQLYAATADGWVCCYATAGAGGTGGGAPCAGWNASAALGSSGQCVSLGAAWGGNGSAVALPPGSGLAVSPATPDFHGGGVYAVDALDYLYGVNAATGVVGVTAAPLSAPPLAAGAAARRGVRGAAGGAGGAAAPGPAPAPAPARSTPLLVVDGFGPGWHALLVPAAGGSVLVAASVGDLGNGGDDDDGGITDDDGGVSTGNVWSLAAAGGEGGGGGGAPATFGPLAVTPEGRVLAPCGGGGVCVVGSARDGGGDVVPLDQPGAIVGIVVGVAAALVLGGVVAVAAAQRKRGLKSRALRARFLIRAAYLAELGEALEGGGQGKPAPEAGHALLPAAAAQGGWG